MPGHASFAYFFFGDLSSVSGRSSYSVGASEGDTGSSTAIAISSVGSGAGLGRWMPSDFAVRNWLLYEDEGAEEEELEAIDGAGLIRGKKESEDWDKLTLSESSRAFLLNKCS